MANRVTSPDSSSSAAETPNVHSINKISPHPEEWTLPHEWNIEKREMFEVVCHVIIAECINN